MAAFEFQKMFPLGPDQTPYRRLTQDFVSLGRYRRRSPCSRSIRRR